MSIDAHVNVSVHRWAQGYLFEKAAFRYSPEYSWNRTKYSNKNSFLTVDRVLNYLVEVVLIEELEIGVLEMCSAEIEAVGIDLSLQDNDRSLGKLTFFVNMQREKAIRSYLVDAHVD
jgi:hypothetical protein